MFGLCDDDVLDQSLNARAAAGVWTSDSRP